MINDCKLKTKSTIKESVISEPEMSGRMNYFREFLRCIGKFEIRERERMVYLREFQGCQIL